MPGWSLVARMQSFSSGLVVPANVDMRSPEFCLWHVVLVSRLSAVERYDGGKSVFDVL